MTDQNLGNQHLSPIADQLFEDWIKALKVLRDPSSSLEALIHIYTFTYYFQDYKFKLWQVFWFPFVTTKILLIKRKYSVSIKFDDPLMIRAEALFSELEFGRHKNCLSYLDRQRVRKAVYRHQINAWQLRQAFNSFAAKAKKKKVQFQPQPEWLVPIAMSVQYVLGISAFSFFLMLCYDAFVDRIITFDLAWPNLLIQLAIIGTFVSHKLGRQWKIGNDVFKKIKAMNAAKA